VGDPDALFDDSSSWKAEYLIGAMVTDMDISICSSIAGLRGQIYLEVNWQVYSRLDRKVVFKTTTEGSYEIEEPADETYYDMILNSFGMATQNLLADEKFYALVAGETKIAAPSPESFNKLVLAKSTQYKSSIEHTINDVRMGVVTVFAGEGHGSGFFIDSEGHMLTSAHVVGGAKFVKIKLVTGREILGEVLRKNPRMDIALVKAGEGNMAPLPINEQELNIGAPVCAIGSPLDQSLSSTVTRGVLSAYRTVEGNTFIQSDVNVLPGSSGCPLVDHQGNAIGVSVSGVFLGGTPAGLNFFVPVNQALNALNVEMVQPTELETKRLLAAKKAKSKPAKPKTVTSDQTQSSKVASTSPIPESIPKPDSRIKLAILPCYMKLGIQKGSTSTDISLTSMKNTSIDSLNKVLRDQGEMVPTHSYYELAKVFKAEKISDRIINDKDVNNLWVKKGGYSSSMKPNINLACKIGNKLKVDTVLLHSITRKTGEWSYTMAIYFIDVKTKKTFSQTTSIWFRTYQNEIKNFTEQTFHAYSMKN
jgi:S1-C subfamily serine protease